jgi:hypothetical protein
MPVKTWFCERDERDPAAPFCATLLVDDQPVASGRGADEMSAFAQLADVLGEQGIAEGRVLGLETLMRNWGALNRRAR